MVRVKLSLVGLKQANFSTLVEDCFIDAVSAAAAVDFSLVEPQPPEFSGIRCTLVFQLFVDTRVKSTSELKLAIEKFVKQRLQQHGLAGVAGQMSIVSVELLRDTRIISSRRRDYPQDLYTDQQQQIQQQYADQGHQYEPSQDQYYNNNNGGVYQQDYPGQHHHQQQQQQQQQDYGENYDANYEPGAEQPPPKVVSLAVTRDSGSGSGSDSDSDDNYQHQYQYNTDQSYQDQDDQDYQDQLLQQQQQQHHQQYDAVANGVGRGENNFDNNNDCDPDMQFVDASGYDDMGNPIGDQQQFDQQQQIYGGVEHTAQHHQHHHDQHHQHHQQHQHVEVETEAPPPAVVSMSVFRDSGSESSDDDVAPAANGFYQGDPGLREMMQGLSVSSLSDDFGVPTQQLPPIPTDPNARYRDSNANAYHQMPSSHGHHSHHHPQHQQQQQHTSVHVTTPTRQSILLQRQQQQQQQQQQHHHHHHGFQDAHQQQQQQHTPPTPTNHHHTVTPSQLPSHTTRTMPTTPGAASASTRGSILRNSRSGLSRDDEAIGHHTSVTSATTATPKPRLTSSVSAAYLHRQRQ